VAGAETVTKLADMPLGDGSTRLPGHRPYYRAADHSLYFTTAGTSTQPGALQRYDLTTGRLSTLHELQDAASSQGPFPEGRFCYGFVAEWNRALYFTTIQGGTAGGGTINRFDLVGGVHEVLFHLDSATGPNPGGECRGGMVFSDHGGTPAFYLTPRQGGVHDHGTILQLTLPAAEAPPAYTAWLQAVAPGLSPAEAAPSADAEGDGSDNYREFAFGMEPDRSDTAATTQAVTEEGVSQLRWTGRADGLASYRVTSNADLQGDWEPVAQAPVMLEVPDVAVPAGYARWQVSVPLAAGGINFLRVEATIAPAALP
jgi:uncharacterized repeat protein (TIGR03803 family)